MDTTKIPLTILILTYNEELNIRQALVNVVGWASDVFLLDSGSVDNTCSIATQAGAKVFTRKFDNYATQRNYALRDLPIETEWVMFLDADEFLTDALKDEITQMAQNGSLNQFDGYYIKRRFYFWGKWIKYGGYYPNWLLRLFKRANASCEREINEHITVMGNTGKLKNDFVDYNHKDFTEWLTKHNKYSTFEATQFDTVSAIKSNFWGSQPERTAWIRQHIWNKFMPPLLRPFVYFFYRYIIRLGFLDGKVGFIYHFMQGLVFLFIIDIKYVEAKMRKGLKK